MGEGMKLSTEQIIGGGTKIIIALHSIVFSCTLEGQGERRNKWTEGCIVVWEIMPGTRSSLLRLAFSLWRSQKYPHSFLMDYCFIPLSLWHRFFLCLIIFWVYPLEEILFCLHTTKITCLPILACSFQFTLPRFSLSCIINGRPWSDIRVLHT